MCMLIYCLFYAYSSMPHSLALYYATLMSWNKLNFIAYLLPKATLNFIQLPLFAFTKNLQLYCHLLQIYSMYVCICSSLLTKLWKLQSCIANLNAYMHAWECMYILYMHVHMVYMQAHVYVCTYAREHICRYKYMYV